MALKFSVFILSFILASAQEVSLVDSEKDIVILRGNRDILTYHKSEVAPPEGAKKAYRRSGFIHPLKSPKGGIVTGIHPGDHLHHLGLWHAWVKSKHGKDQPDFWNLGKESGKVRFLKLLNKNATGFTVEQEQVAFKGSKKDETVILKEALSISVRTTNEANIIDYHLTQKMFPVKS